MLGIDSFNFTMSDPTDEEPDYFDPNICLDQDPPDSSSWYPTSSSYQGHSGFTDTIDSGQYSSMSLTNYQDSYTTPLGGNLTEEDPNSDP